MDTILEVRHLSSVYGSQPILSGVSFSLKRGDFMAIIGANGAGKSTLMKLLLAKLSPQQGEITLFGQALSHFRDWPKIDYTPQNGAAANENFPATAEEIVCANLRSQTGSLRLGGERQRERTRQALESVNMLSYAKRMLSEFSGGQQQRVVPIRVPAASPRMTLLDKPATRVDAQTVQPLRGLLGRLNRETGLTIIVTTHDIAGAMDTVNRVLCLENGSLVELNHAQLLGEAKHRHKHPIPPKQTNQTYSVQAATCRSSRSGQLVRSGRAPCVFEISPLRGMVLVSIPDYESTQRTFLVGILLVVTVPCIGIVVVLERLSMTGDALSHTSLAGVVVGLVLRINPILGAVAARIAAVPSIEVIRKKILKYSESSTAIILSAGVGLTGVLSSFAKNAADFSSFLPGSTVAISDFELILVCCTNAAVLVCFLVLYRELFLTTLDERTARLAGVPVKTVNFIFTILTAVTVSVAVRTAGVLIIFSLMVISVTCTMQIARSYYQTVLWSIVFALLFTVSGLFPSYYTRPRPGVTVVPIGVVVLVIILLAKSLFGARGHADA